jgi:hypothetical protein
MQLLHAMCNKAAGGSFLVLAAQRAALLNMLLLYCEAWCCVEMKGACCSTLKHLLQQHHALGEVRLV